MNEIPFQKILDVTTSFYDKAKVDFMIGYHFRIIDNFEEHIPKISRFWYLQLNKKFYLEKKELFNIIHSHMKLNIKKAELGRWIVLFHQTLEKEDIELQLLWKEKIENFKKIFLNNPSLF